MKNLLLILVVLSLNGSLVFAQVGIGQQPADSSILDLSNDKNFHLLLPKTLSEPNAFMLKNEAAILYYDGKLYLNTNHGIQVFSPWKWNGDSTSVISSPSTATVGIGVVPATGVLFRLQVAGVSGDATDSTTSSAIVVGDPFADHLLIDNNEIMAKKDAMNADTLRLQEEDGGVVIRGKSAKTNTTVLKANGSIDAAGNGSIKENGYDLLPKNTIIMWYGVCDANGYPLMDGTEPNKNWHICDGTNGTPDLRERFIVGAGGDNPSVSGSGYNGYPANSTGGANRVTLTTAETPIKSHNHTGSASGSINGTTNNTGAHIHEAKEWTGGDFLDLTQDRVLGFVDQKNSSTQTGGTDGSPKISILSNGSHEHTVSGSCTIPALNINNTTDATASSHENLPPFYALVFIMKLP